MNSRYGTLLVLCFDNEYISRARNAITFSASHCWGDCITRSQLCEICLKYWVACMQCYSQHERYIPTFSISVDLYSYTMLLNVQLHSWFANFLACTRTSEMKTLRHACRLTFRWYTHDMAPMGSRVGKLASSHCQETAQSLTSLAYRNGTNTSPPIHDKY